MYATPTGGGAVARARRAAASGRLGRVSASPAVRLSMGGGGGAQQQQQQQQQQQNAQQLLPGAVLLNDEITSVSVNSVLPAEVRQELAHVEPYSDPFSGFIDSTINYAVLVTRKSVLVWNHVARGVLPSTCFRLALPPTANKADPLPLAALAPSPSGREPGVVVVTPGGSVYFVESVPAAEQVQDGQRVGITLVPNEAVTVVRRYGMYSFAIATSHSRLFRLTIVLQDGRRVAQVAAFTHSKGLLGRLFGSSSTYGLSSEPILSLALGEGGAGTGGTGVKLLYALSPNSVQRWHVVEGGVDTLAVEQDVKALITTAVQQARDGHADAGLGGPAISLVDSAVTVNGALAILFVERQNSAVASSAGIAVLDFNATSSSLSVAFIKTLKGIFEADSRAEYRPQLVIPHASAAAFVVQPSSVTACLLQSSFEFQVVLKNQSKSRIFGVGYQLTAPGDATKSSVALITTSTAPLLVNVDISRAAERDVSLKNAKDREEAATATLLSFVRQAVLFGQQPLNPLAFILSASHDGNLALAAERLSDEFISTDASEVAAVMDVRSYLAGKKEKLAALIAFIRSSGQLGTLPTVTRRKLCADAELIDAASACYSAHDAGIRSRSYRHLLAQAIAAVMEARGLDPQEDVIRTFFRKHVILLPDVFGALIDAARMVANAPVPDRTDVFSEMNHIVLAAYIAGMRRRELSSTSYGLTSEPVAFEAWSFTVPALELLELLFHATERLIADRTRELGSTVDAEHASGQGAAEEARRAQRELKTQLCDLADYALNTFEDRLLYLVASSDAQLGNEHKLLERRYKVTRSRMIMPLVAVGRQDKAFQLAERHGDYNTLTKLCQEAAGGALTERAAKYVQRYGQDFAVELYQWHIEHERIQDLLVLGESPEQSKLLYVYLEKTGNTRLAWLQQLRMREYWGASSSLLQTVKAEPDLRSRKLMLSLSKLAYAAVLDEDSLALPEAQTAIHTIGENMDMVATQVKLLGKLKTYLTVEADHDVDAAVREITSFAASRLDAYPAFETLFVQALKKLWNNQAVTSEELIDLFTLRDCADDEVSSYVSALEVFVRATDDPAARRTDYLRSIWRRIILHDDWAAIADTEGVDDETINTALRRTALYYVMKSIKGRAGYELATVEPQDLVHAPSTDSLRGRFENVPDQYLQEVKSDYDTETAAVGVVLATHEAWLQQVYRLVIRDDEEEQEAEGELETENDFEREETFGEEEEEDKTGEQEGAEAEEEMREHSADADIAMDG